MTYKEKVDSFRASCRAYKQEKERLEDLNKEADDPVRKQYMQYLAADVAFVENTLDLIEEKCGTNARVVIWDIYVENRTQVSEAQELHISRRQLQYSLDKWMHSVFDE